MRVFIGWDARERLGWQVCAASLQASSGRAVPVEPISRPDLERHGLYQRPWHRSERGVLVDEISRAPMATDFSLARFWVPALAGGRGWAVFCDCDFLWRADVAELLDLADPRCAVMVVKHAHAPAEKLKMDGQVQTRYPRKNWSSLVLWNLEHEGTQRLSAYTLNNATGLALHGFCWLRDEEIGALPESWNWLDGHSPATIDPNAVHFTRGTPDMMGYEHTKYAPEWNRYAQAFARRAA